MMISLRFASVYDLTSRIMAELRSRRALVVVYFAVTFAALSLIIRQTGLLTSALIVTSLLITATLPGAVLVRRMFNQGSAVHYFVVGTVLGLGLLSLGGLLSQVSGLYVVRWVPSVLAAAVTFVPRRALHQRVDKGRTEFPAIGIIGSLISFVALAPSLWAVLKSQPLAWDGWYRLYVDLTFQIALAGEVASRVPSEFPWVGEPLSYPWLFHSAMGVWSSATGVPAADLVLQAWPIVYSCLIPAMISIVAWQVTRRKYVAFGAPIVFVLTHGLIFAPGLLQDFPLFQISPTRDFAHLFILLAVMALNETLGKRAVNWWWLLPLGVGGAVAAGSKSSSLPVLVGGVLCASAVLLVSRRFHMRDLFVLSGFIGANVLGFLLVVPVRGLNDAVVIDPLSFLRPDAPDRLSMSLIVVLTVFVAIVSTWVLVGRADSAAWAPGALIAGVCLAGLMGVAVLGHPGMSQLYFWQAAQPVFSILLAWGAWTLIDRQGWRAVSALLLVFFLGHVISTISRKPWVLVGAVLAGSTLIAIFASRDGSEQNRGRWPRSFAILAVIATAGFLPQAAQIIRVPTGYVGGNSSAASDQGAIHSSQLAAFRYIRENSDPGDQILSNAHCREGSVPQGTCDSRWFTASAFTERRVWVEGWAYTPHGFSSTWIADRLERNDRFIISPSEAEARDFSNLGISYIYVDKRQPFSSRLSDVATLTYDGEWASVYRLDD